jgi:nucleotide-binding universal stress UspA family protein
VIRFSTQSPSSCNLAAADELAVDVIVTGTRSLHGLREVIANTLSHHLIQHSPLPVLAIPTPVGEDAD